MVEVVEVVVGVGMAGATSVKLAHPVQPIVEHAHLQHLGVAMVPATTAKLVPLVQAIAGHVLDLPSYNPVIIVS